MSPTPWFCLFVLAAAGGAERTADFDSPRPLEGWVVRGAVSVGAERARSGRALRVGPGGVAIWPVRSAEGGGTVEMWVYEDMTVPADPKKRRLGPRWGLAGSPPPAAPKPGGKALVVGAIYAPYLAGERTYAASDYRGETWFHVTYLGECRRTAGWHRWTFTMDPQRGLSIAMDGKDVNARRKRFDWNRTKFTSLVGVVLLGDEPGPGAQVLWVDDVTVSPAGPMKVRPTPPPPPPPVVPAADPPVEKPVALSAVGRGPHPRLLFGREDIPHLRAFARGEGSELLATLEKYLPVCSAPGDTKFLRDATDAQRQGLWRAPTAALHYVLTGRKDSLEKAVSFLRLFAGLKHWEEGKERDSGMGAANIMVGAALAYDFCHDALEPAFRREVREKLLWHARAMYHGGHLMKNRSATAYWQQDPQNNHRWHRDAGLALCALAAAEGRGDEQWILAKTLEELTFVADWLPPDGTSHEGPAYLPFGGAHLTLAMQAADRCFGTKFLDRPFFRNVARFRLHTLAPGLTAPLPFGDCAGLGGYNNFLYKACAQHRLADEQAGVRAFHRRNPKAFEFAWMSLLWLEATLRGGALENLPTAAFFEDLGLACIRDGWEAGDAAAMFKCGPYGGRRLNEYRNARDFHYVNVAHDDPDVNSFLLYARGALLAETSRYSKKKLTASHNTILVNGAGQRGEGSGWTQPLRRGEKDMTTLGRVTAWKDAGAVVAVEGEGAGAYPDLARYRRTMLWIAGRYVLLLDDIRAAGGKDVKLAWLVQAPRLEAAGDGDGRFVLAKDAARCALHAATRPALKAGIGDSPADHRGKPLGWRQLRLTGRGKAFRVAAVFDLWDRRGLRVELAGADGEATVTVRGPDGEDRWTWQPAGDAARPSVLTARREGKVFFRLAPGQGRKGR